MLFNSKTEIDIHKDDEHYFANESNLLFVIIVGTHLSQVYTFVYDDISVAYDRFSKECEEYGRFLSIIQSKQQMDLYLTNNKEIFNKVSMKNF